MLKYIHMKGTPNVRTEIESSLRDLMALDEEGLAIELGRRLNRVRSEIENAKEMSELTAINLFGHTQESDGKREFFKEVGQSFLSKFGREMYSLVCDPKDKDHKQVAAAVSNGAERLGYVLVGVLVSHFGWLPGIATVAATILAKRISSSGHSALCETWKMRL